MGRRPAIFTTSAPSHAALDAHADRIVGRRVRTRVGRVDLAEERDLAQYRAWGASAPDGVDVVHVGHVADVAAYLCGTGSAAACEIAERLGTTVTSDDPVEHARSTTPTTGPADQPGGSVR